MISNYKAFWESVYKKYELRFQGVDLLGELIGELKKDVIDKCDPCLLLEHEKEQLKLNPDPCSHNREWEVLKFRLEEAEKAMQENELIKACWEFYWLGVASKSLEIEKIDPLQAAKDTKFFKESLGAILEKHARERPFKEKNIRLNYLKKLSVQYANLLCSDDKHAKLRIGKVAEEVQKILRKTITDDDVRVLIPSDLAVMKKWLRGNVPEYLSKRGAPKN